MANGARFYVVGETGKKTGVCERRDPVSSNGKPVIHFISLRYASLNHLAVAPLTHPMLMDRTHPKH